MPMRAPGIKAPPFDHSRFLGVLIRWSYETVYRGSAQDSWTALCQSVGWMRRSSHDKLCCNMGNSHWESSEKIRGSSKQEKNGLKETLFRTFSLPRTILERKLLIGYLPLHELCLRSLVTMLLFVKHRISKISTLNFKMNIFARQFISFSWLSEFTRLRLINDKISLYTSLYSI